MELSSKVELTPRVLSFSSTAASALSACSSPFEVLFVQKKSAWKSPSTFFKASYSNNFCNVTCRPRWSELPDSLEDALLQWSFLVLLLSGGPGPTDEGPGVTLLSLQEMLLPCLSRWSVRRCSSSVSSAVKPLPTLFLHQALLSVRPFWTQHCFSVKLDHAFLTHIVTDLSHGVHCGILERWYHTLACLCVHTLAQ